MINHQITKLLHNVYQKNKAKFTHLETGKPMTFVGGDGIWFFESGSCVLVPAWTIKIIIQGYTNWSFGN